MKAKDYLLKHGHIKEVTRGRLSRDNIAIIEKAVSEGVFIEGYSAKNDTVVKVPVSTSKEIQETGPIFWPIGEYDAFELRNGKRFSRGMKEVCRNCGVSLVQCHCGAPIIVSLPGSGTGTEGVRVYIERL